jgi:hypothetical protein
MRPQQSVNSHWFLILFVAVVILLSSTSDFSLVQAQASIPAMNLVQNAVLLEDRLRLT